VSPSGTGVRIIGRATGGKINTKNGNVEIYRDASRYITITGKALNGTTALDNIDAHIDAYQKEPSKEPKSSSNNLIPLRDIMEEEFEPIKWVLPHYVTEGCTLFVGRPKIGKRAGSGFFDRAISGISA
jgi:hypothetical protein